MPRDNDYRGFGVEEKKPVYLDWVMPEGVEELQGEALETHIAKLLDEQTRGDFDRIAAEIHPTNREKGFWKEPEMMDKYVAKLALIHSEVTEVLEALRKSQGADKVTEEFADIFIRTFDLYHVLVEAGEADPELYGVIRDKMKTNASRPVKHGNRWG